VQFYTKCAVLNPFVQFLKHKCAVTKLTKIALIKTVFSFIRYPCGCSTKFQKCCHQLSIKNINDFWGRTPDPPIFLTNYFTCWGNGKEGTGYVWEYCIYNLSKKACTDKQSIYT
jgi:hypothetical protein